MGHPRGNRGAVARPALRQRGENVLALVNPEIDPRRDLLERAEAAGAKPRQRVDHADTDAGRPRKHGFVPTRVHDVAAAGSGSFASSARATRETGVRPRNSEMYLPASRSRVMSTPVSMPNPSRRNSTSSLATLPVAPL